MPPSEDHIRLAGIYQIRHIASGKVYIGSAVCFRERWSKHKADLNAGRHHSQRLQRAWDKYGGDAFDWEIIEIAADLIDADDLLPIEQGYLDRLRPWDSKIGYNISKSAIHPMLGRKHSPGTLAKMSATQKNRGPISEETRARMSQASRGRRLSDEAKAKLSAHFKGRKLGPEHRAKCGVAQKGRKQSPELLAKLSAIRKGRRLSAEHRAKLSVAGKGRAVSEETREKISAAQKGRKGKTPDAEHRAKLSAALKGRQKSPETIAKMVEAQRNRSPESHPKPSDETRAKMRAAQGARRERERELRQTVDLRQAEFAFPDNSGGG